jgi:hypothetical protein
MRLAAAMAILALGLSACETSSNIGGVADYDALSKAAADCKAQGGELVLKDGGDAQYIQDYACKRK